MAERNREREFDRRSGRWARHALRTIVCRMTWLFENIKLLLVEKSKCFTTTKLCETNLISIWRSRQESNFFYSQKSKMTGQHEEIEPPHKNTQIVSCPCWGTCIDLRQQTRKGRLRVLGNEICIWSNLTRSSGKITWRDLSDVNLRVSLLSTFKNEQLLSVVSRHFHLANGQ